MEKAVFVAKQERKGCSILQNSAIAPQYQKVYNTYKESGKDNIAFRTVKFIESDEEELKQNKGLFNSKVLDEGKDYESIVANERYKYLSETLKGVIQGNNNTAKLSLSDKIDKIFTNKYLGIPIFLAIMFAVFHFTFSENFLYLSWAIPEAENPTIWNDIFGNGAINAPGTILFNIMDIATSKLGELVAQQLPEGTWYTSMVNDGILGGVFAVLSFVPQILTLFLCLSILEDSGYMARVAFIMDRAFRKFGLSGKAFLPLIMCFGCAIPGIMATRTIENPKERRLTIMLAPFFSCGAKLPIWACMGSVLFNGMHKDLIVYSVYVLGIAVAIISALIIKKFVIKGETSVFIMELPEYRRPKFSNTIAYLWQKLKNYLVKAATIIAGATVVIWFLTSFSFKFEFVADQGDSILGTISKGISWLFVPVGFGMGSDGWKFVVAAFSGLIAKEMVVSVMGMFAGMSEDVLEMDENSLIGTAFGTLITSMAGGVPAALAFMAFNLLSVPCMAAVAAASGELSSKRQLFATILYWLATAYIVSALIFWIGTYPWLAIVIVALIAIAIVLAIVIKKRNSNKESGNGNYNSVNRSRVSGNYSSSDNVKSS